jgi:uncharacterized membrane protein
MKLSSAGWGRGAAASTGNAAVDMGSTVAGTDSTAAGNAAVEAVAAGWGQGQMGEDT